VSKLLTVAWGILAIIIALTAGLFENLIQLVNILGSLFYGTILGVFLLAFFFKRIGGTAAFIAGIIGQIVVLSCHFLSVYGYIELGYLLYNVIGSGTVIIMGIIIQTFLKNNTKPELIPSEN
jgi:Na+(H+)/acetate symporter ActP